jgi:probable phosphoglycerate mutase
MAVTRLYLVRHGQSDGNAEGRFGGHGPTPLSALGVKQAEATAKLLTKEGVNAIYSSDLHRALQTAQPLSQLTGIPIIPTSAFRERNVGVLEGLTFDESKQTFPKDYYALVNRNVHHVITDGESYRHLLRRSTTQLWEILRDHMGGRVAIFSHTGAICFMTLHLMGAIRRDTNRRRGSSRRTAGSTVLRSAAGTTSASLLSTTRGISRMSRGMMPSPLDD